MTEKNDIKSLLEKLRATIPTEKADEIDRERSDDSYFEEDDAAEENRAKAEKTENTPYIEDLKSEDTDPERGADDEEFDDSEEYEDEAAEDRDGYEDEAAEDRDGYEDEAAEDRDGYEDEAAEDRDGYEDEAAEDRDVYEDEVAEDRDGYEDEAAESSDEDEDDGEVPWSTDEAAALAAEDAPKAEAALPKTDAPCKTVEPDHVPAETDAAVRVTDLRRSTASEEGGQVDVTRMDIPAQMASFAQMKQPEEIPVYLPEKKKKKSGTDTVSAETDAVYTDIDTTEQKPAPASKTCPEAYGFHEKTGLFGTNDNMSDGSDSADSVRNKNITVAILKKLRLTSVLTVAVALICLCTVWWEGSQRLVQYIARAAGLESMTYFPALADTLLLFAAMLCFLPSAVRSVRALREGVVAPSFAVLFTCTLSFVYMVVRTVVGRSAVYTVLPAVVLILIYLLCDIFYLSSLARSAQICMHSRGGTSVKLRAVADVEEVKKAFEEYDRYPKQMMSTGALSDFGGFFTRLGTAYISTKGNIVHIASAFFAAVICTALTARNTEVLNAVGYGIITLCTCMPLSLFLTHTWTMNRLSAKLRNARMIVAGESSVYEASEADVVCFADTYAFPSDKTQIVKIKHCGGNRLDLLLSRLSALFHTVGGPLDGLLSVCGESFPERMRVTLLETTPDGICADIDGTTLLVGKGSYMEQNSIAFFYDSEDEARIDEGNIGVLFVAANGSGCGKLYVRYALNEDFRDLTASLAKRDVYTLLRTCDPGITQKLIERTAYTEKGRVAVIYAGASAAAAAVECGTVAYGVPPQKIYPIRFLYSAYRNLQKTLPFLSAVTVPLCCVLTTAIASAGVAALTPLCVMCQLLCTLPSVLVIETILGKYHIGDTTDDK